MSSVGVAGAEVGEGSGGDGFDADGAADGGGHVVAAGGWSEGAGEIGVAGGGGVVPREDSVEEGAGVFGFEGSGVFGRGLDAERAAVPLVGEVADEGADAVVEGAGLGGFEFGASEGHGAVAGVAVAIDADGASVEGSEPVRVVEVGALPAAFEVAVEDGGVVPVDGEGGVLESEKGECSVVGAPSDATAVEGAGAEQFVGLGPGHGGWGSRWWGNWPQPGEGDRV